MNILPADIEQYAGKHTEDENAVLAELNRETYAKVLMPTMLSGQLQGAFLRMLTSMIKPEKVLEIGTFTGYTAICFMQAMGAKGELHTIDINAELRSMAESYIAKAGFDKQIKLHTGNALTIIPQLNETFDLVFIDADKINYSNYYDLVFDKVRKGGYIIADNVLWSGKVLQPNPDPDTKAIIDFNNKVKADTRVEKVLVPIRDGLMVMRKK
jgi:predicted O-methyltransferase YrrM